MKKGFRILTILVLATSLRSVPDQVATHLEFLLKGEAYPYENSIDHRGQSRHRA
jgi:hypothetical protein